MSDTFAVLAEPRRRQILDVLLERDETSVGELVEALGMSQPAVSKHLRVLRERGLVVVRPIGQQRRYRIDPTPLTELDEWLTPYRAHWRAALGRLDVHLTTTREPGDPAGDERTPT